MKLLFVIKGLVIEGGGAERVFVDVANAMARKGHDVVIATFDRPEGALFYDVEEDVSVHRLGTGKPGLPTPRRSVAVTMARLRKLAASLHPDVAIGFMHSTYVPMTFSLLGTGIPLVLSEHASLAYFADKPLQRALVNLVHRQSYAKTVVSEAIRREHPAERQARVVVLPNPVAIGQFSANIRATPQARILCVGGLREEKGHDTLIAAFDAIAADHPDWHLRIVGDGATRPKIEALLSTTIHADRIELAGIIRDVMPEYGQAAFTVVPSRNESLSLVAVESMASGRPVIGFADCAGPAALIDDGENGVLVDPGSDRTAALAGAMDAMIRDEDRRQRMGRVAPATVAQFSAENVISAWEDLLHSASKSRG
ncbi:glycosyltransferase [Aurantiacibacter gangjinensis]|uniref:Glycosyltransferase subfamily 4-like N-terminal domain-containing protein n=1 Tax=Aurantiacibacter gangjinensis TaxID=502682 RepID=A0A0G9MMD0_9SPHN|nr:glycosyltransferase [Aurantiacibacter gangjinensis]APE27889.1 Glycosyltransferase [Aurantiacibacter gangjinensis]KLE31852.1 hypothetical protein AAW01_10270 [Aurantiacibacter gangjinensis]